MTTFIVEGRCDCPRLARLQLFADRVMHTMPNVHITFRTYTSEEYAERFKQYIRSVSDPGILSISLPFVHTPEGKIIGNDSHFMSYLSRKFKIAEDEPDLKGPSLEEAVQRLVFQNIDSLTEETNCKLYGVSVEKEAQQRYDDIATLSCVSNWSNPGFKVLPDVKLLLTHDCGGRVMLLRSSIFHKLQQLQQQLFLKEEHTHSGFLLRATIPRSAASAAKGKVPKGCFRLLLHHSPLTHKHLVFVPAQCLNENHYKHRHPKTGLVSLVTGPSGIEKLTDVTGELRMRNVICLTEWSGAVSTCQTTTTGDQNGDPQCGGTVPSSSAFFLLLVGFPNDVTDSRVLLESNAPPAMSVVLGKVSELAAAQRDALLALEAPLVELDAAEDAAQIASRIEELLRSAASSAPAPPPLAVSRRAPCRLGDEDWRAIGELVGSFDCLVTFQWMPQGWRDHRRPLDSHLQVFPLPLSDAFPRGFGLAPAVERTLASQRVLIPHLPFAHALIKVRGEADVAKAAAVVGGVSQPRSSVLTEEDDAFSLDSLTAAAEHEQLPPERKAPCEADSHRDAFEIALRVVASVTRGVWDAASEGASLVMSRHFLLLIPHPSPFLRDGAAEASTETCSSSSGRESAGPASPSPSNPAAESSWPASSPSDAAAAAAPSLNSPTTPFPLEDLPPSRRRRGSGGGGDAARPSRFFVWKEWGLPPALAFVGGPAPVNPLGGAWRDVEEDDDDDALGKKHASPPKDAFPRGGGASLDREQERLTPLRVVRQRREPYGGLSLSQASSRLVLREHALEKPFSALAEFCVKLPKDECF